MKNFFNESRLVFKNKPSSAPQEAPKQDVEAGKDTWKTLEELQAAVTPVVDALQKRFDDISEQYDVVVSGTEFEGEYEQSYIKAGMPKRLRDAIKKGVETFTTIMDAIEQVKSQQEAVKSKLATKVTAFNEQYKAAVSSSDPLDPTLLTNSGDIEFNPNAAPAPEPKQEEAAPEVKEATPDQKFQSSIIDVMAHRDGHVNAQALLDKCAAKQLEITKDSPLYVRGMENVDVNGEAKITLIRALVTPSTDGKSVRVEYWFSGGTAEVTRDAKVYNVDADRETTPEFEKATEQQQETSNQEKNREQLRKDVEWLKTAPIGSRVKLNDTTYYLKDADGELYIVLMKDGKEQSRSEYKEEKIEAKTEGLTTAEGGISILDASDEDKKKATELYRAGGEALQKGHLDTALSKFQEAYKTVASPNIHMMIVQVFFEKGAYDQAYTEAKACAAEYDKLLPQRPDYADDKAKLVEIQGNIEDRLRTGSIMVADVRQKPEQMPAGVPEQKEVATRKMDKLAKNIAELSSIPPIGNIKKIISDNAKLIGKIAKENGIDSYSKQYEGRTHDHILVEYSGNKVSWKPVDKKGRDIKDELQYARGEVKIDSASA
mgnify:CR=1 FL=1